MHANNFISLETLSLRLHSENNGSLFKAIDNIELMTLKTIQGFVFFEDDMKIDFILFDGDLVSKVTWNKISRTHNQNVYKIKTRHNSKILAFIIAGEKYIINDVICPSFILFSASSELILGVLVEDSAKFWTMNCETSSIESALYSEEMSLLYLNSREKSGFYTVKLIVYLFI